MKKNILLVEYNSEVIEAINQYLNHDLFDITTAGDVNVARMLLAKKPFHMVITAALLPKSHGFTLAQFITQNYPDTKIMVIGEKMENSAYHQEATQYGVCEFLEKPLNEVSFRKKVLFHLGIEKNSFHVNTDANSTNFMVLPPLDQLRPNSQKPPDISPITTIKEHAEDENDAYEIDLDDL